MPQGDAPNIDLSAEKRLWDLLLSGIAKGLILSAKEVGEGGLGIALTKMSILSRLGCEAQITLPKREMLFSQTQSCVVVETSDFAQLQELAKLHSFPCVLLGEVLGGDSISIQVKIDSALGEQCGSVADFVKGTNAKFANLPQNPQSNHSPTAKPATAVQGEAEAGFFRTPRILEKDNQAECKKSAQTQKLDSSTASSNQQASNPQAIHLSIQEAGEIFFQSFAKHLGINA